MLFVIVGLMMCIPFIVVPPLTMPAIAFFSILLFIVGLPMFFIGIVTLFVKESNGPRHGSYNDLDLSRIRFEAEQDRLNRRKND